MRAEHMANRSMQQVSGKRVKGHVDSPPSSLTHQAR